jgi:LacI family transcriptional regulator
VDAAGYDILIYSGWPDRPTRSSGLDFLNGHIDGLLWVVPQADAPALARVAAAGLPTIGALTRHVPPGVGYVNGDNLGAMLALMSHLVSQGHRRIAFSGPIHSSNFRDRLEGYRQGLAAAGLVWDAALEATTVVKQNPEEICGQALDQWLALAEPPTAIVLSHDAMATWVAQKLQARGKRVPEDIALTGFDDVPDAQTLCGGLTTIRQPFHQIGRVAAEKLIALIEGAPIETARVTLPLSLVVRASTSPPRS